ncbi:MAG: hypothetical protein O9267_03810 [Flavobacterium sp.]|uniref:hypothetical protein n=1 Tax=Flavobacterium sp. TaxID=239 RepID=UPI0022CA5FB4|nr:hypothetical protein [Flavobacterium sp.]MCZ8196717.1 hypothetical protein [Flavobacterium sp.]
MEEKLKDVYENIKDRLSNPLIFSFISSWLICNWRIPVALIWYDKSQFSGCGCNTIFDYIELTYAKYGNTWLPVLIAFGYTLLIPFIKNAIRIVSAQAQKWGEEKEIKILDGSKIGIDKYLTLRESYLEKTKRLEEIISSESKYIVELDAKSKEIDELKLNNDSLNERINEANDFLLNYKDAKVLNGKWFFKRFNEKNQLSIEEKYNIVENQIQVKQKNGNDFYLKYNIIFYYHIVREKRIQFVKEVHDYDQSKIGDRYIICDLTYGKDKIIGTENKLKVEYIKDNDELPF